LLGFCETFDGEGEDSRKEARGRVFGQRKLFDEGLVIEQDDL